MRLEHTGSKVCPPSLASTLVLTRRGNIDGEIMQRVVAAGSESDKYREYSDNEQQKKCCKNGVYKCSR